MQTQVQVHDKIFEPFLSKEQIAATVQQMAKDITRDLHGKNPLFLAVLNGSFIFAADLVRACEMELEVTFVKLASYHGTQSSGKIKELIGLNEDLRGRHILLVEDIIDSGLTMQQLLQTLETYQPASVRVATLLLKPEALECSLDIAYCGFEIPPDFVLGYGLDYDGLGRNLPHLYRLKESQKNTQTQVA